LVRFVAGPLCDRFGPRYVFAGTLVAGAIPTAFAWRIRNATDLIVLRFFVGILGGSFVPCQVWSTGFFDKNIVGTANAFTGGFGNSGGGATYFIMPAIFEHFESHYHYSAHWAWRYSFFVPFGIIMGMAVLLVVTCPDTPTGKWSQRQAAVEANLAELHQTGRIVDQPGRAPSVVAAHHHHEKDEKSSETSQDIEHGTGEVVEIDSKYQHEVVVKPSPREIFGVCISPQTLALASWYFCSFGQELSINSILGAYYLKNFPYLGQTSSGRWAAMFGLLNIYGRPAGGIIADFIYKRTNGSLWAKKILIHVLGIVMAVFMLAIGFTDSKHRDTMVGLVAGLAFFMDAGNGAIYALVPHVHPQANGIVSGAVGGIGNFGGIIGAIIFRYDGTSYGKSIYILGFMTIAIHVLTCWIPPLPKGQIGGR